ncbi:hypothetical protein JCM10212_005312, partial [Sporobolomyces blumeae]
MAPPLPPLERVLEPYRAQPTLRNTPLTILHFVLTFAALVVQLPFHLVSHYVLRRSSSPLVQTVGRHPLAQVASRVIRSSFGNTYLAASRGIFAMQLGWRDEWIRRVDVDGLKGVWVSPPRSERKDDELVLYWIHGGAFTYDIIGSNLPFFKALAVRMNATGTTRFSIFMLDYRLAPEYVYPAQVIETERGYRYLTETLSIPSDRISIGGDSAGANLVTSFLLHLARANAAVDEALGSRPTVEKPSSTILMSPFASLISSCASRTASAKTLVDFLESANVTLGAFQYLGLDPTPQGLVAGPSWDPRRWFGFRQGEEPEDLFERAMIDSTARDGNDDEQNCPNCSNGTNGTFATHARTINSFGRDPYLNPDPRVVKDLEWYKAAFPGQGRTVVTY